MPVTKAQIGGIVSDIDPNLVSSGTADISLNVTLQNGELRRRSGFSVFDADVTGSADSILNMTAAVFGDGDVYVVVKAADGDLWQRKSTASSFTKIVTSQTHNAADTGWFFMAHDRLHYFDRGHATSRGGGSRWNPDVNTGNAYKAGLPKPAVDPTLSQDATWLSTNTEGEKEGFYHVTLKYVNLKTGEEGPMSDAQSPPCKCLLSVNKGRIGIDNWSTFKASSDFWAYEFDHVRAMCTMGTTEFMSVPELPNQGVECYSFAYYGDSIQPKNASSLGMHKADHVIRREERQTNAGGEPPGSLVGCYTGSRAIYGRVFDMVPSIATPTTYTKTFLPDKIMYSIPGYPTMVPQTYDYSKGSNNYRFNPQPYTAEINGAITGLTAMAHGGGITAAFSAQSTYRLSTMSDGRLRPRVLHQSKGAAGMQCAIGTVHGVFALGMRTFLWISSDGIVDLAENRFSTTLAEIPAAYVSSSVMGYYGYREEVWCAVAKTGATVVQRILVWDVKRKLLTIFEPSCLAADESITSMCEYAAPGVEPVMLVGTSAGRILKYPDGTDDAGTGFVSQWRGWFGQERIHKSQTLAACEVHTGDTVAGNVTWKTQTRRSGSTTVTERSETFGTSDNNRLVNVLTKTDQLEGRIWSIEFYSGTSCSDDWQIRQVVFVT